MDSWEPGKVANLQTALTRFEGAVISLGFIASSLMKREAERDPDFPAYVLRSLDGYLGTLDADVPSEALVETRKFVQGYVADAEKYIALLNEASPKKRPLWQRVFGR